MSPPEPADGSSSAPTDPSPLGCRLALVLSGGNALGAYQAGAYEALAAAGLEPDWIAGASIGAVNGAILCGNPPERRLERLRALWDPGEGASFIDGPGQSSFEESRRTAAALATLAAGRPGLFVPRNPFARWFNPWAEDPAASLYDNRPLERTLERLVDFDRLNGGTPRLSITAVDLASGADIVFDTQRHALSVAHLRASCALLPVFQPVEVDGRLLGDPGLSANLPLDTVLAAEEDTPLLCIAIDLLPLAAAPPRTLGEAIERAQDLVFATQSRRAIAAWQAVYDARASSGPARAVTILHVAYANDEREVSGKAFDFSAASARERWTAGFDDVKAALAQLRAGAIRTDRPGLSLYRRSTSDPQRFEQEHWSLAPKHG